MSENREYDAIVIGSGQGGTPLATALSGEGLKTALIERREVGGTCVNYGCTPTKTMVASARAARVVDRAAEYGIGAGKPSVDMVRIRERKRAIVSSFRGGSERRVSNAKNLTLFRGTARFAGRHLVEVEEPGGKEFRLDSEKIFINAGTRPAVPTFPGLSEVPCLDNESIMELDSVPSHLMIVGGGYIGVEFAQMFRRFGSKVTIVQRQPRLLPREDAELSEAVEELLRSEGIELLLEAEPLSVSSQQKTASSRTAGIGLVAGIGGSERRIEGSHLLLAAGRTPNTDLLNPAAAGLRTDPRGYLEVNDRLETGVDGIWALGDIKGGPAFTHVSYDDYRILFRNVAQGGDASTRSRLLPYTVFIDPQLGRVGMSETEARAAGRDVLVASIPMTWVARALETDETVGLMKAVVDAQTEEILGFGMLGIEAGEVASAVQIAMMGRLPYTALRDGMFSHPTVMESLNTLFSSVR